MTIGHAITEAKLNNRHTGQSRLYSGQVGAIGNRDREDHIRGAVRNCVETMSAESLAIVCCVKDPPRESVALGKDFSIAGLNHGASVALLPHKQPFLLNFICKAPQRGYGVERRRSSAKYYEEAVF